MSTNGGLADVTSIGQEARRRAANALLSAAAGLAALADELDDLRRRSRLDDHDRERFASLATEELEARRHYLEAEGRYRAVMRLHASLI